MADRVRYTGFNGAVTLRSRKRGWYSQRIESGCGFNGAVTLRSRKRGQTGSGREVDRVLQWGRDLAVTETSDGGAAGGAGQ